MWKNKINNEILLYILISSRYKDRYLHYQIKNERTLIKNINILR